MSSFRLKQKRRERNKTNREIQANRGVVAVVSNKRSIRLAINNDGHCCVDLTPEAAARLAERLDNCSAEMQRKQQRSIKLKIDSST